MTVIRSAAEVLVGNRTIVCAAGTLAIERGEVLQRESMPGTSGSTLVLLLSDIAKNPQIQLGEGQRSRVLLASKLKFIHG